MVEVESFGGSGDGGGAGGEVGGGGGSAVGEDVIVVKTIDMLGDVTVVTDVRKVVSMVVERKILVEKEV